MVHPHVTHGLDVNRLLQKAMRHRHMCGLHFRQVPWPLRIVGIADAGHASKKTAYSYEGKMVLLMHDGVEAESEWLNAVSYTHLRAHETSAHL
eukprot:13444994-Alexandrium_andersonii.AAC.1